MIARVDYRSDVLSTAAAPGWMVSFADLLALLLAFFVLVFSASPVDRTRWQVLAPAIATGFTSKPLPASESTVPAHATSDRSPAFVAELLRRAVTEDVRLTGATVELGEHETRLNLANMPESASSAALAAIAQLLSGWDNQIALAVGLPVPGEAAADDWMRALDSARGLAARLGGLMGGREIASAGMVLPGTSEKRLAIIVGEAAEGMNAAP